VISWRNEKGEELLFTSSKVPTFHVFLLQSIYYMDSRISILRNSVLPLGRRKFKLPAGTLLISRFLFYGKLHPYLFQCRNFEEFDLY
jgi:hypothetical protein